MKFFYMKNMIHPIYNKTFVVLTNGASYKSYLIGNKTKYFFLDQDNKSHIFWNDKRNINNIEVGGRRAKFQKRFSNK